MGISRQPSPIQITVDQKQVQNMGFSKNDAGSTSKIKSRIVVAKAVFNKAKSISPANWI
jgi:hypothetical protein